jgi:hypothetical protein
MSNFVEFENRAPWSPGAKKTLSLAHLYRGVGAWAADYMHNTTSFVRPAAAHIRGSLELDTTSRVASTQTSLCRRAYLRHSSVVRLKKLNKRHDFCDTTPHMIALLNIQIYNYQFF